MRALVGAIAFMLVAACTPETDGPAEPPAQQSQEANIAAMPAWENLREAQIVYRAIGQEPGWMLDIHTSRRALLLLDYGERLIAFDLPYRHIRPSEAAYEADADGLAISITISNGPCEDVMSGQPFPERVEVQVGERTYRGCGGIIYNDDPTAQREG